MSSKLDFNDNPIIESNNHTEFQQNAQRLLSLPRSVKQIILLSADFIMSVVCLFFALSLRYGYIANHISPLMLCLYALPPLIGLYFIGFYRGVARIFFDATMRNVLQLFVGLIIVYQVLIYFEWISIIPNSVPILYLFFLFI